MSGAELHNYVYFVRFEPSRFTRTVFESDFKVCFTKTTTEPEALRYLKIIDDMSKHHTLRLQVLKEDDFQNLLLQERLERAG